VIATASAGPLRCAYGTPRDWLIGIRVVHADGGVTRAGGKVVKNVAGYDLCKLYAGSFGTLAVIAEMSFKLRALPPVEKTLVFYSHDVNSLCALVARVNDSDVQPAAMELISPSNDLALAIENNQFALALRFLNEAEAVDSQIEEAAKMGAGLKHTVLSEADADVFWRGYRESETSSQIASSLRLSALPADLPAALADVDLTLPETNWRAHAANGVVRIYAETEIELSRIAGLRNRAQSRGGQLVILHAPSAIKEQLDVWGETGQTASLMRALKEKFDPQAQLNPGRFVAGI
jgi:glycolate oxidase FAD binding subunit